MQPTYDADQVRNFYDNYGAREWDRLQATPALVANFEVHRSFLQRYIRPGDRVLEAGAGPGRFTIELARLGARITVGDISPRQLELNAEKVAEAGCEASVEARELLDIADLAQYKDAAFDAVVCYGGPVSYMFDRADQAVAELLRVLRPGGRLLLSVMSLLGTTRDFVLPCMALARQFGIEAVERVTATGDLDGTINGGHRCHMFTWAELKALLERHACTVEAGAASNYLMTNLAGDGLRSIMESEPALWEMLLRWELDFCSQPGAVDGGTHIIAVARRS